MAPKSASVPATPARRAKSRLSSPSRVAASIPAALRLSASSVPTRTTPVAREMESGVDR